MKGMMVKLDEVEASPRKDAKVWHISGATDAEKMSMHVVRCEPGGEVGGREHSHEFEEFVYAYFGSGEEIVGEHHFPLEPGVLVYIPPNTPHMTRASGDEPLEVVVVYAHDR